MLQHVNLKLGASGGKKDVTLKKKPITWRQIRLRKTSYGQETESLKEIKLSELKW